MGVPGVVETSPAETRLRLGSLPALPSAPQLWAYWL